MKIAPSIVIPFYNEAGNLAPLFAELSEALKKLPAETEVIFVDDGSTDGGGVQLAGLIAGKKQFRLISFRRNYGQTAALSCGIRAAPGNVIVTMDADLQNDPADIPAMLSSIEKGEDVVSGWRKKRNDPYLSKILPSSIANWLISRALGLKLHDYGCTLKAYRAEFVKELSLQGEMHRFIPAYCHWQGAMIAEQEVNHRARTHGRSKYTLGRTFKVILDLCVVKFLLSYIGKPIYVFGGMFFGSLALGTLVNLYVLFRKLFLGGEWMSPLFFIGFLLWTFSITCLFLGLLAEVLVRLYLDASKYPGYKVKGDL